MPYSIDTQCVHAGRDDLVEQGVHTPPIDLSTTYPIRDQKMGGESLEQLANGVRTAQSPVYQRLHNPTVARFEAALAELEGTETSVAFASGMASITAVFQAACVMSGKRHVVANRPLYGGTDGLLSSPLLGLDVTWVEPHEVAGALRPETGLVVLETPGNPTLELSDIEAVVEQAGSVPVLVDNTFATPFLQNPASFGATYVLHSATKYLGGHGDVMAGVVACSEEAARPLRQVRVATGAVTHPLAAYMAHRGLGTLALRMRTAQANAAMLASRLVSHPAVDRVFYPGLPGSDLCDLIGIGRQMRGGGAILAFETSGDACKVVSTLRLITPAVSLGSLDTLIEHPFGLTHRLLDEQGMKDGAITPGTLRISVGVEDSDDLWADLSLALDAGLLESAVAQQTQTVGTRNRSDEKGAVR